MPKPMPMNLMVEEIAFGKIFRMLSGMPGVISIDIDADSIAKSGKPAAKRAPQSPSEGTTSACVMLRALSAVDKLERQALMQAMLEAGKKASTLNGALGKLSQEKLVKSDGAGLYKITAKGKRHFVETCGG